MEMFDKFAEKAKEIAGAASKKTEATVEISRLKLRLSQTDSQLKSTFERIGTLVYEESQGFADNADLTEICIKEASNLEREKKELLQKISLLKDKRVCPKCKSENPSDKKYCSECGSKLK